MNAASATSPREPSACEVQCQKQQDALTRCMNAIRDAREEVLTATNNKNKNIDTNNDNDIGNVDTTCLAPSVAAWTECCSRANNGAVESNQGHIGIH